LTDLNTSIFSAMSLQTPCAHLTKREANPTFLEKAQATFPNTKIQKKYSTQCTRPSLGACNNLPPAQTLSPFAPHDLFWASLLCRCRSTSPPFLQTSAIHAQPYWSEPQYQDPAISGQIKVTG